MDIHNICGDTFPFFALLSIQSFFVAFFFSPPLSSFSSFCVIPFCLSPDNGMSNGRCVHSNERQDVKNVRLIRV